MRLISTELEAILLLHRHGPLSSGGLMRKMRCSNAGFHIVKRKLLDSGLITAARTTVDRRSVILTLDPTVRHELDLLLGPATAIAS